VRYARYAWPPMTTEFSVAFRAALESGRLTDLADAYAPDAAFEGYLPGGLREAHGPRAIVAELERQLGPAPIVRDWTVKTPTWIELEIARRGSRRGKPGSTAPAARLRQFHVFAVDHAGLVTRQWAYPMMLDTVAGGDSGARHRRVERPDGSVVYEKLISPSHDWLMRATRDPGREAILWRDGVINALPGGLVDPILSAEPEGDGWRLTMPDVSAELHQPDPSTDWWRRVMTSLDALHERYRGRPPRGICRLEDRHQALAERTALAEVDGMDRVPKMIQHGWRAAPGLLPDDVRDRLITLAREPDLLIAALSDAAPTMLHGDASPGNLGIRGDTVFAIDWALAASGPPEVEFAWLFAHSARLDELLDLTREILGRHHHELRLRLALLYNFVWMLPLITWWRAVCPPDEVAAADVELAWWLASAREGLAVLDGRRLTRPR